MIKDQADDLDLGDETLEARQFERAQLGNAVVQLRMFAKSYPARNNVLFTIYAVRHHTLLIQTHLETKVENWYFVNWSNHVNLALLN